MNASIEIGYVIRGDLRQEIAQSFWCRPIDDVTVEQNSGSTRNSDDREDALIWQQRSDGTNELSGQTDWCTSHRARGIQEQSQIERRECGEIAILAAECNLEAKRIFVEPTHMRKYSQQLPDQHEKRSQQSY